MGWRAGTELLVLLRKIVPGTEQDPPGTMQFQGSVATIGAAAVTQLPAVFATYDSDVSTPDGQWLAHEIV